MRIHPAVLAVVVAVAVVSGCKDEKKASRFVYVWSAAGTMEKPGPNMLAVIDADPESGKYGAVLDVLTVDSVGGMAHHSELELPAGGPLFLNDYHQDKSYVVDFSEPMKPTLVGRMDSVPHARMAHSFAKLPSGNTIATVQFGDKTVKGDPGGLAEFDKSGKLVRYTSSIDPAFQDSAIRTYGLTMLPAIDRIVTTSSPMDMERPANVVQVWRMSDLKLLKTLPVPQVAGDSAGLFPFELKTLADGKSVMMHTYYCGFYHLTNIDSEPKIERAMAMEHPKNIGCSVPIIVGKFMVVPVAYAHRYATLDISNPSRPVEVSSADMDSTFFPHWISHDPLSDRVVVTDQGDGPAKLWIGHFDAVTGKLNLKEGVRLSFEDVSWPNGVKGKVRPHGAVFVP